MQKLNRRKLITTTLAGAMGVAVGGGAARAASGGLRRSYHRVRWPVEAPRRIVQLTDVHMGWATPDRVIREVVDAVLVARPDVVVLTGDYVNHSLKHVARVRRLVEALPGPVVATLGNHDHWSGAGGVIDALRGGGARVLSNESLRLGDLVFAGVDDGGTKHDDVDRTLRGIDPARAVILNHYPRTADHIAAAGGRLILAGHTHGGQVAVPGVTVLLARAGGLDYLAGWYTLGSARLYVNAGCGQSAEGLRYGRAARPEVAIFDLEPA